MAHSTTPHAADGSWTSQLMGLYARMATARSSRRERAAVVEAAGERAMLWGHCEWRGKWVCLLCSPFSRIVGSGDSGLGKSPRRVNCLPIQAMPP